MSIIKNFLALHIPLICPSQINNKLLFTHLILCNDLPTYQNTYSCNDDFS